MAGTEIQVEGLPGYRASTVLAASSTPVNSLEGGFSVDTLVNGALCFVTENGNVYRWYATSTTTPVGDVVVIPLGQAVGTPGRWILEVAAGPPTALSVVATGAQQDWVPGGDAAAWDKAEAVFLDTGGGGALTIGGLAAPLTPQSPHVKRLYKTTAADTVVLVNEDVGSVLTNRLRVAAAATTADASNEGWEIAYLGARWRVLGGEAVA